MQTTPATPTRANSKDSHVEASSLYIANQVPQTQPVSCHPPQADNRLLSTNNVAKRIGLPERTVRYFAQIGIIPAYKPGKRSWRFRPRDIEQYIKDRENEAACDYRQLRQE